MITPRPRARPVVYNAYPLMHSTGIYQGQRAESPDKRVVILTRSAYAGQQRNAAITWSGDISGNVGGFPKSDPGGMNFSLTGIPYWNTDTGGFGGGNRSDPKYARALHPLVSIQRLLSHVPRARQCTGDAKEPTQEDNPGKEMWQFPPETKKS